MRKPFCLLLAVLLGACTVEEKMLPDSLYLSSRLIDAYKSMSDLRLVFDASSASLKVYDHGDQWIYGSKKDELSRKYDDTHYQRMLYPGTYASFANAFSAITVISDTEFDGIAPGEDLGSRIRIVAVSPYKWLRSKGTETCAWTPLSDDFVSLYSKGERADFLRPENHPVNEWLTSLAPEDLLLLNVNSIRLLFTVTPSVRTHALTVTFSEGERRFSATVDVVF